MMRSNSTKYEQQQYSKTNEESYTHEVDDDYEDSDEDIMTITSDMLSVMSKTMKAAAAAVTTTAASTKSNTMKLIFQGKSLRKPSSVFNTSRSSSDETPTQNTKAPIEYNIGIFRKLSKQAKVQQEQEHQDIDDENGIITDEDICTLDDGVITIVSGGLNSGIITAAGDSTSEYKPTLYQKFPPVHDIHQSKGQATKEVLLEDGAVNTTTSTTNIPILTSDNVNTTMEESTTDEEYDDINNNLDIEQASNNSGTSSTGTSAIKRLFTNNATILISTSVLNKVGGSNNNNEIALSESSTTKQDNKTLNGNNKKYYSSTSDNGDDDDDDSQLLPQQQHKHQEEPISVWKQNFMGFRFDRCILFMILIFIIAVAVIVTAMVVLLGDNNNGNNNNNNNSKNLSSSEASSSTSTTQPTLPPINIKDILEDRASTTSSPTMMVDDDIAITQPASIPVIHSPPTLSPTVRSKKQSKTTKGDDDDNDDNDNNDIDNDNDIFDNDVDHNDIDNDGYDNDVVDDGDDNGDNDESIINNSNNNNTNSGIIDLDSIILSITPQSESRLNRIGSPQYLAKERIREELLNDTDYDNELRNLSDERIVQIWTLLTLWYSTDGMNWYYNNNNNDLPWWLQNIANECNWDGIVCDDNNHITEINLSGKNLHGIIQPEIYLFGQTLVHFDVSNNRLTGTVPKAIGALQTLEYFNIADNELTGTIPYTVHSMHNLQTFYIQGNTEITGTFPKRILELDNLQQLVLWNTGITSLPTDICTMNTLQELIFDCTIIQNITCYTQCCDNNIRLLRRNKQEQEGTFWIDEGNNDNRHSNKNDRLLERCY